jgi:CRISPR-associated protein Cas2
MLYLVAYDIADDRRLREVAKMMEAYGNRVQRSVFECSLSRSQLAGLIHDSKMRMNKLEDKLQIYKLCEDCRERFSRHTDAEISRDPDVWIC